MSMDSQGENSIHHLPHIVDFRLECCILVKIAKNNTREQVSEHLLLKPFEFHLTMNRLPLC